MCNQFRAFIQVYSGLTKCLTELTKKCNNFAWDDKHQQAFVLLQQAIASAGTLFHYDPVLTTILRTDASVSGIGGVLLQLSPDGTERFIYFVSKTLSEQAARWTTIELEAYAVYYCIVVKLSQFLLGRKFYLETDHRNLLWLEQASAPKLIRWRLRHQEYSYIVIHIAGKVNLIADTLSRSGEIKILKGKNVSHFNKLIPANEMRYISIRNRSYGQYQ
jgi:hypothetical protein